MSPFRRFLLCALIFPLVAVGTVAEDANPAKAEADLKAVRSQIDKVRAEMERDAGKRDQLTRELEESEKTVGTARGALERLRRERAVHTARRAELAAERRTEEAALRSMERGIPLVNVRLVQGRCLEALRDSVLRHGRALRVHRVCRGILTTQ